MQPNINGSRILVTGGAGFIGSYVIEELIPLKPAKIVTVDNFIRGSRANMKSFANNPLVEFVEGDIRDNALMD